MNAQMILVISSPSSSTTGFFTSILAIGCGPWSLCVGGDGPPGAAEWRYGTARRAVALTGRCDRCYRRAVAGPLLARICLTSTMATVLHPSRESEAPWQTHEVFNQPPPLEGVDGAPATVPRGGAVRGGGGGGVSGRAPARGRLVGGEPQQEWGRLAN